MRFYHAWGTVLGIECLVWLIKQMHPHSIYIPEGEEEKQQQQINDEKIYCKKPGSDCCFSESKAGENWIEGSG